MGSPADHSPVIGKPLLSDVLTDTKVRKVLWCGPIVQLGRAVEFSTADKKLRM